MQLDPETEAHYIKTLAEQEWCYYPVYLLGSSMVAPFLDDEQVFGLGVVIRDRPNYTRIAFAHYHAGSFAEAADEAARLNIRRGLTMELCREIVDSSILIT